MNVKILLFMFLVFAIPEVVWGQNMISGTVREAGGGPLPGVNITIQGTTSGTVTDANGTYSINASPDDLLSFSFIGFKTITEKVGTRNSIDVEMISDVSQLGEVVVVGYNSARVKTLSSAIEKVEMDHVQDLPAGNAMKNIQGRVAGIQVYSNGNPASTATVRIRGAGLGRLGNNDPLYVIDGMPTTAGMHELNQNDIESIQILKDASAASIYGSRAANGVVVITTKNGGKSLKIDVKSTVTNESFKFNVGPLNTEERAEVLWRAAINDKTDPNNISALYQYEWNGDYDNPQLNKILIPEYIDPTSRQMKAANTNWFEEITRPSFIQDHNISLSNGSERGRYFMSFGYYNHDGIVKYSNFKRYSLKLNSEYDITKNGKIKFGENFTITNQRANKVNDLAGGAIGLSLEQQSIVPIRTVDGKGWGGPTGGITDRDNPVRLIEENKDNQYRFNRILGNLYLELKPLKTDDLKVRSSFGVDYNIFSYRDFTKASNPGSITIEDQLNNTFRQTGNWVWSNTAIYERDFSGHILSFLLGSESIAYAEEEFKASRRGFTGQNLDYAYLDAGTSDMANSGYGKKWSLQSFFGKVDYNFEDKYLASFTIRRDGSSRFGANNRYGNFPAASVGWRLSEEKFLQDVSFISELKIRGSWGLTGNQEIDPRAKNTIFESRYYTQSLFTDRQDNGTAYDFYGRNSGQLQSGFAKSQTSNPDLKWETSETLDVGIDFGFLQDKFTASADYYIKTTHDILTRTEPVAAAGEGANQFVNGGSVENTGIEISLGYSTKVNVGSRSLGIDINGNVSHIRNKVVELPLIVANRFGGNGADQTVLGRSVESVYGYVADGLFQSQEEVDAAPTQSGAAPGRIRFKDLNSDLVIDGNDQMFFTKTTPDYVFGLNMDFTYGKFDLNLFFQGIQGGQVRNDFRLFTDFTGVNAGSNYGRRTLDAWTPENTDTDVPALSLLNNNNEWRVSTFQFENQSYVKLRNVSVGFRPKSEKLTQIGFTNVRVFLAGQNLFTAKASSLLQDPETPGAGFPVPRRITLGVNLSF